MAIDDDPRFDKAETYTRLGTCAPASNYRPFVVVRTMSSVWVKNPIENVKEENCLLGTDKAVKTLLSQTVCL